MSIMANLTHYMRIKSDNSAKERDLYDYLPMFLWLLHSSAPTSPFQRFEDALQDRPHEAVNNIRVALGYEANFDVRILCNGSLPAFKNLKDKIFKETPIKKILGQSIGGKDLVRLMTTYLEHVNSGGRLTVLSAWASVAYLKAQSVVEDAVSMYKTKLQELEKRLPICEIEIKKLEAEFRRAAVSRFEDFPVDATVKTPFRRKLDQSLDDTCRLLNEANERLSEKYNSMLLQALYDKHVELKLKAKQFQTSHDLIASWKHIASEYSKCSKGANRLAVLTQFQTNYLPQSLTQYVDQLNEANVAKIEQERKKTEEAAKRFESAQQEVHQAKEKAHKFELETQREAAEKLREKRRSQHLEKEKAKLESELNKTSGQLDEATKHAKSAEKGYQSLVNALKEELKMKDDHVKHVQNESQERHKTLQNAEKENQRLTQELKDLLKRLNREYDSFSNRLMQADKEIAASDAKVKAQPTNGQLESEIKMLKSKLANPVGNLAGSSTSNSNLAQEQQNEIEVQHEANKLKELKKIEDMIKSNNWEALASILQQNCSERVMQELYPSSTNLSTKTFIDNLAIHSLKSLVYEVHYRSAKLQEQLDTNNSTMKSLTEQRDELRKQLKDVEAKITIVDMNVKKESKELTENTSVQEKLGENIKIYQAALKKNEPALKKWQQKLQTDLGEWTGDDVSLLLKEVGLGRYSGSFVTNNIDGAVLQQLETNDLITALDVPFKDAKKLLMYLYLVQTHHDIYTIPPGVLQWNNDTVCTWLEDNKFAHLKDVFKKNEITGAELVFLERADLISQLQIKAIGDVIKLQKELSRLKESIQVEGVLQNQLQNNNNNDMANSQLQRQLEEVKRFNEELKITLKERQTKIPEAFICPITQDMMNDPVVASDGHTYERTAIELWLKNNNSSPMTGLQLVNKQLTPSHTLKSMIREFIDANKNKE